MKTSFIATVLNEEKNINAFLSSIFLQTKMPDEFIIVDGGSTDATASVISNFKFQISNKKVKFKFIIKKGNRSVGRNEAIENSTGDIIVCSDAGNILDKHWIENIIKPFKDPKVDVVSGYYKGRPETIFEKCLVPFVLVMEDKIDPNNFLPAARSIAFKKTIWEKVDGFTQKYSNNEDYVFAQKLKKVKAKIVFQKDAIVNWIPRKNIWKTFIMFFRFAFGDAESNILRSKVILIFARYALVFYFLLLTFIEKSPIPLYISIFGVFAYIIWSIKKNYKYVNDRQALFFLPLLQFISDFAVIIGTKLGLLKKINFYSFFKLISPNKSIVFLTAVYIFIMLMLIDKGIPNNSHPFNYFMDEWHQAQSVRSVFTQGSPNVPGAANGSMFHFMLSGIWLMPFTIIGFINPFIISSPVENLEMQQRLFQVLRLNTLFFGVFSVILIAYIAKKYFKLNLFLVSFLFIINPIWLSFSNYFKYDIALVFWILLSFVFLFKFLREQEVKYFYISAFVCGIAFAVKVSALPLVLILILTFILNPKKNFKELSFGILIFLGTFLTFGIPDLLLGRGNIGEYLYDNIVKTPSLLNYKLEEPYLIYLTTKVPSAVFGYVFYSVTVLGVIFLLFYLIKNKNIKTFDYRIKLILLLSFFVFLLSLIPLKIEARGNRLLVLLPFISLIGGIFITNVFNLNFFLKRKILIFLVLISFGIFQTLESFSWVYTKLQKDPRQISSEWIAKNTASNSIMGIESIPIYQFLPDIALKEFYEREYLNSTVTKYRYQLLNTRDKVLPNIVVISNEETVGFLKESPKRYILESLKKNSYKKIYSTKLNISLLKIFRDEYDYYMSGLPQSPISISIYKK